MSILKIRNLVLISESLREDFQPFLGRPSNINILFSNKRLTIIDETKRNEMKNYNRRNEMKNYIRRNETKKKKSDKQNDYFKIIRFVRPLYLAALFTLECKVK